VKYCVCNCCDFFAVLLCTFTERLVPAEIIKAVKSRNWNTAVCIDYSYHYISIVTSLCYGKMLSHRIVNNELILSCPVSFFYFLVEYSEC
jgi:hypothetical protein